MLGRGDLSSTVSVLRPPAFGKRGSSYNRYVIVRFLAKYRQGATGRCGLAGTAGAGGRVGVGVRRPGSRSARSALASRGEVDDLALDLGESTRGQHGPGTAVLPGCDDAVVPPRAADGRRR